MHERVPPGGSEVGDRIGLDGVGGVEFDHPQICPVTSGKFTQFRGVVGIPARRVVHAAYMVCPSAASLRAVTSPMPVAAPVISMTDLRSSLSMNVTRLQGVGCPTWPFVSYARVRQAAQLGAITTNGGGWASPADW